MGEIYLNAKRRGLIKEALGKLSDIESIIDIVRDDEEESMDNIPENLQYSDRYERIENTVYTLNEALEIVDQLNGKLEEAIYC